MLLDQKFERINGYKHLRCECTGCGTEHSVSYSNLTSGKTHACDACARLCGAPAWLIRRCASAKSRCQRSTDAGYPRYGGRGIEFRFATTAEAAVWVVENLGLERDKELDRIDNNGHYEPGNLRWVSRRQNVANQRRSHSKAFHRFRQDHPEIRYADNTLRRLFSTGMTPDEIVERWHQKSDKPKGVYGTFSTPDPDIVSL
jgi:hypothetical protein